MKLSLLVIDGIHAGEVIDFQGLYLLIGSGPQCHVRPKSPAVSPRHCALLVRQGVFVVRDLESQEGTYINDRRFRGEIELRDGDLLRVGPLSFLVHMTVGEAASAAFATDDPPAESLLEAWAPTPHATETQVLPAGDTQEMAVLEPYPYEVAADESERVSPAVAVSVPATPIPAAPAAAAPPSYARRLRLTRLTMNGTMRRPPT